MGPLARSMCAQMARPLPPRPSGCNSESALLKDPGPPGNFNGGKQIGSISGSYGGSSQSMLSSSIIAHFEVGPP